MNRIATPLFSLIIAALMWPVPVFALDHHNTVTGNVCEVRGQMDLRMLLVADSGPPHGLSDAKMAGVRKIEEVPIVFDIAGRAVADARQETKLSLLQNVPVALPISPRTGNDRHDEQWVRVADSRVPEPGTWAVLIAGILGICAVARPRVFSS